MNDFESVNCKKCNKLELNLNVDYPAFWYKKSIDDGKNWFWLCAECDDNFCALYREKLRFLFKEFIQPERSKREDSHSCEMRCSEHCGNTVRGK